MMTNFLLHISSYMCAVYSYHHYYLELTTPTFIIPLANQHADRRNNISTDDTMHIISCFVSPRYGFLTNINVIASIYLTITVASSQV
jgi:hypothetical protein